MFRQTRGPKMAGSDAQGIILVVERVSWAYLPDLWRILRGKKEIEVYVSDSGQRQWLPSLWQKLLGVSRCRSLKEVSSPDAVGGSTEHSVEVTEIVWENWITRNVKLQKSLSIFFRDSGITFAYKKQLAIYVEELLEAYLNACSLGRNRACSVLFAPHDPNVAAAILAIAIGHGWIPQDKRVQLLTYGLARSLLRRCSTTIMTLLFPLFTLWRFIRRRGLCVTSSPVMFHRVGCPNTFGLSNGSGTFPQDLFFVDGTLGDSTSNISHAF